MTQHRSRSRRSLLLGLVVALGCDLAPTSGVRSVVERGEAAPASAAVEAVADTRAEAVEMPHAAGISVVTHGVVNPPRTGDPKEDYWIQFQIFGELRNDTTQTIEMASANLTFYDAAGKMLGVESIGTLSKLDAGDTSPGETIWADVHFVEPGQSVPFFFRRNLAAIDGEIASHKLVPRSARPALDPPKGVVLDLRERFEGEGFEKKRIFEGRVRNDGVGGCRWPALVIGFLDADGKLFAFEHHDLTGDTKRVLARGEEIEFAASVSVAFADAPREHAPIRTWVDCNPVR